MARPIAWNVFASACAVACSMEPTSLLLTPFMASAKPDLTADSSSSSNGTASFTETSVTDLSLVIEKPPATKNSSFSPYYNVI
jgi:hypothetical protein